MTEIYIRTVVESLSDSLNELCYLFPDHIGYKVTLNHFSISSTTHGLKIIQHKDLFTPK